MLATQGRGYFGRLLAASTSLSRDPAILLTLDLLKVPMEISDQESLRSLPGSPKVASGQLTSRRNRHVNHNSVFTGSAPDFAEIVLAILFAARHRLRLALLLSLLFSVVLVVAAWHFTKPTYVAESLLQIRQFQDVVFKPQSSRGDDVAFVRAQEQVAVSRQVLTAALKDDQLTPYSHLIPQSKSTAWLKSLLDVDIHIGAETMSVSAQHAVPELAQLLCNSVTNAYLVEIDSRLSADRNRRQAELEKAAREADVRLDELWNELNDVASKVGSDDAISLTMRDEMQHQSYREYAQRLRTAEMRATELRSQLAVAEVALTKQANDQDSIGDVSIHENPSIVELRGNISRLDTQLRQLREIAANGQAPHILRLKEEQGYFQTRLEQELLAAQEKVRQQAQLARKNKLEGDVAQLQKLIDLNQTDVDFLRARMGELDAAVVRTAEKNGVQLEISRHALNRQTRLADSLWQTLEEFIIESHPPPRVILQKLADLPVQASHKQQIIVASGAGFAGAFLVIFTIGLIERQSCLVRNSNDLLACCARPTYGSASIAKSHRTRSLAPSSGSFELAARMMLHSKADNSSPCVLVSSAMSDEARHMVALDLAFAFRSLLRRTLLIDVDTAGKLTRSLAAENSPGVLQLKPSSPDFRHYIIPTQDAELDFLALGTSAEAEPWIDPACFKQLLGCLQADYESIVICGPSLSSPAECLLLASEARQLVFAAVAGKSRWDKLSHAETLAINAGIHVLGSILHPPQHKHQLTLRFAEQGPNAGIGDCEDQAENSVRADLSAIQQQIEQAASKATETSNKLPAKIPS